MKKKCLIYFLSMAAFVATSCTSDQFSDISVAETNAASQDVKSAADKVFKMEYVASGALANYYGTNSMCTDSFGNLYFLSINSYFEPLNIKVNKYDITTGQTSVLFELGSLSHPAFCDTQSICIDNEQNLYYADLFYIYKINLREGSIVNLTSRFPAQHNFTGLCAADNGNVFVNSWGSLYRITAQGNVTEINHGNMDYSNIFKSSGAFVYGFPSMITFESSNPFFKASTTNGTVETYNDYRIPIQSLTAALNNSNAYALSGNTIMELRPNLAKDLLVGTIPDYIINKDGSLKKLGHPSWIIANANASIFYIYFYNQDGTTGVTENDIYKLTLE